MPPYVRPLLQAMSVQISGLSFVTLAGLAIFLISVSFYNYLLYHTLVEFFAIGVGALMMVVAWQTYPYTRNNFLMFLACGFFWIAAIDLVHTLVYKGMNIYPISSANPATQFWIVARYWQALLMLAAPLFLVRSLNKIFTFIGFGVIAVIFYALVMTGNFPDAFIEGQGLTPFKITSEYVIIAILVGALVHLIKTRAQLEPGVLMLLAVAIVLTIFAELSFTLYVSVYGLSNLVGHIFKLFSFWLVFTAIIRVNLHRPYVDLVNEISEHKAVEEELHQFEHIVSTSRDMLAFLDKNFVYKATNSAYLNAFSKTHDEIVGYSIAEIFGEDVFNSLIKPNAQRCLSGNVVNFQTWHHYPAHKARYMDIFYIPYKNKAGEVTGFVVSARDITERQAVEEALLSAKADAVLANQAKSEFLASMSHELRTPLNSIIGFAEMMHYEIKGPLSEDYKEYTGLITRSGRMLLETINSVLDIAKIEAGKFELYKEPTLTSGIVDEVISILDIQAQEKGLVIRNETHDTQQLRIDPLRIKQVLLNIVGNALKFTDKGHVTITSHCDEMGCNIIVTDTGIGLTEAQIIIALQPFRQVQGTSLARRYQGTGLGLSFSQKIMELHGGELTVASVPNKGSAVTLHFPPEVVLNKKT